MEKNQIIGFVLIFIIITAWSLLNEPTAIEDIPQTEIDVPAQAENIESTAPISLVESIGDSLGVAEKAILRSQYSVFGSSILGKNEDVVLENDKIKILFSSKGGTIKYIELKDYYKIIENENQEVSKSLVRLFENSKNKFNYQLSLEGKKINTQDLFFDVSQNGSKVTFSLKGDDGASFEQVYSLNEGSYTIDYNIQTKGLKGIITNDPAAVSMEIKNHLDKIEQNFTFEKRYSTIYFREKDEDSDYCSCTSSDVEDLGAQPVQWFSFAHQFFNISLIAKDKSFNGLLATTEYLDDSAEELKIASTRTNVPLTGDDSFAMQIYAGPNEFKLLSAFDNHLQDIIPFGRSIFGTINRVMIRPFFDWLTQFINSKGLVIILLIFIIKTALYPLTYKMLHSQAKMGALKPQLATMKEKYKDDAQKQQVETMKVYREYGVNPVGGCLPMVIQMPIWYALFRFFPASITFRQEPFLWASDLSSYDSFIHLPFTIPSLGAHLSLFTILWAISTVIYTYYNMRHMDMSANPAMKYVQYFMPLMFFFFFNNYASGLTCYMLFSNLINIGQTVLTKNFVFDDEKIMAELNIKKSKPKKTTGFQARLEQAMQQQQKIQEEKKNQPKKK
jgi:YidC/Oxa1 family membrane protein insertase